MSFVSFFGLLSLSLPDVFLRLCLLCLSSCSCSSLYSALSPGLGLLEIWSWSCSWSLVLGSWFWSWSLVLVLVLGLWSLVLVMLLVLTSERTDLDLLVLVLTNLYLELGLCSFRNPSPFFVFVRTMPITWQQRKLPITTSSKIPALISF